MCVSKTGRWSDALRLTLEKVYDPTTRMPVPWLLSGDSALAVQGINVEPEVIEFRAISQFAAAYFAQFMRPYEVPALAPTVVYRQGGNMAPSDNWRSNMHQRIVGWSVGGRATWLGRWHVAGIPVEVSYLRSVHPDPVAQAVATTTRTMHGVRRAHFEESEVAVVPLEFLLADNALRGQTQMTHRIMQAMRACGYRQEDLDKALDELPADKASRIQRLLEFNLIAG